MTQESLGKEVGISKKSVSDHERGKQSPSRKHLAKYAEILGTTELYLSHGIDDGTPTGADPAEPLKPPDEAHEKDGTRLAVTTHEPASGGYPMSLTSVKNVLDSILESGNHPIIRALMWNLDAFSAAAALESEYKNRITELEKKNSRLEARERRASKEGREPREKVGRT